MSLFPIMGCAEVVAFSSSLFDSGWLFAVDAMPPPGIHTLWFLSLASKLSGSANGSQGGYRRAPGGSASSKMERGADRMQADADAVVVVAPERCPDTFDPDQPSSNWRAYG
jgi:hypothetical protein